MLAALLAFSCVSLAAALVGLLLFGARWKRSGRFRNLLYAGQMAAVAGVVTEAVWHVSLHVLLGTAFLVLAASLGAAFLRPDWNPPGQFFLATLALASSSFVALSVSFAISRPPVESLLNVPLILLELFAFLLLLANTHEVLDVLCRTKWRRRSLGVDRGDFEPFVSVHVATHNEPPELVIQTLESLQGLDYPSYEVIVLDNNTYDRSLWEPVHAFCEGTDIRFVHLEDWPGYKSGALNHGLKICDSRTEIIAVIDSDFVVDPDFLDRTVGHFADPRMAIVQTAQGFRSEVETGFYLRLALTYKTFDEITMPPRNERNAIIFAGTMGLIRKDVLEAAGSWGEWCVTEDAELSLRILARGYKAQYVETVFGHGVMPLTFAAMKSQRFRWCFGGVQILREHWRLMLTGRGADKGGTALHLTRGQRYDYMVAALQWFQAPLSVIFGAMLIFGAVAKVSGFELSIRPVFGFFVGAPLLLLTTGLIRGLWALKTRMKVSTLDALAVFAIFLSMNWAVSLAAFQGLVRKEGVFLRTPKFKENESFKQVVATTRAETPWAIALTAAAVLAAVTGSGPEAVFLSALSGWGALVFWMAPVTAFVVSRTELRTPALRARRRLEGARQRKSLHRRPASYALVGATAFFILFGFGLGTTLDPEEGGMDDLFSIPNEQTDRERELEVDDQTEIVPVEEDIAPEDLVVEDERLDETSGSVPGGAGAREGQDPASNPAATAAPIQTPAPAATPGGAQPTTAPGPGSQPSPAPQPSPASRPSPAPKPTPAPAEPTPAAKPTSRPAPSSRP